MRGRYQGFWGLPNLTAAEAARVAEANTLWLNSMALCEAVANVGGTFLGERPEDRGPPIPSLWAQEEMLELERRVGAVRAAVGTENEEQDVAGGRVGRFLEARRSAPRARVRRCRRRAPSRPGKRRRSGRRRIGRSSPTWTSAATRSSTAPSRTWAGASRSGTRPGTSAGATPTRCSGRCATQHTPLRRLLCAF